MVYSLVVAKSDEVRWSPSAPQKTCPLHTRIRTPLFVLSCPCLMVFPQVGQVSSCHAHRGDIQLLLAGLNQFQDCCFLVPTVSVVISSTAYPSRDFNGNSRGTAAMGFGQLWDSAKVKSLQQPQRGLCLVVSWVYHRDKISAFICLTFTHWGLRSLQFPGSRPVQEMLTLDFALYQSKSFLLVLKVLLYYRY